MKKSLKLVAIFMAVVIVVIVGGLSIYFLIQNNKTYYIYDVRIVEPFEDANYFVYTDSEVKYTTFKNVERYMTSSEENRFEIAIYAYTSNNSTNVKVTSSNTGVANVYSEDGRCYVHYYHAGTAVITASLDGVEDSFMLTVFDKVVDNFVVYDSMYYGDFADRFPNQVYAFSDGNSYSFNYKATSHSNDGNEDKVDSELLRIARVENINIDADTDLNNLSGNIKSVSIDTANKTLNITVKDGLTKNADAIIVIQSYFKTSDGSIKVREDGDVMIYVHIMARTPQYLQMEISATNNFLEKTVYMNTRGDINGETAEGKDLEDYLTNVNAVNYLTQNGEKPVYHVYFNDEVNHFYFKFRKVYTNGFVQELNGMNQSTELFNYDGKTTSGLVQGEIKYLTGHDYYELTLSRTNFSSKDGTYKITLTITIDDTDAQMSFDFEFHYQEFADDPTLFYSYDEDSRVFNYTYWDLRMEYENTITNENGEIIDLIDIDKSGFAGFYEQNKTSLNSLGDVILPELEVQNKKQSKSADNV